MTPSRLLAWVLLPAVAGSACGYHLAGRGSVLPEHVRTIAVPVFENRTSEPDIAQRLTERVVDQFISRGGLRATSEATDADARLEGAVTQYRSFPVVVGADGLATRYEIQLQIEAKLLDLRTEQVLWSDDHFVFRAQYDVPQDPTRYFNQSIIGIERVSEEAARSVVATILEGF
ncbi:MAG: LptE family protein [Acidobacteriota bacterium]|jgi:outer membrane lipopolysaccharide assembly protein LptE/RlpB